MQQTNDTQQYRLWCLHGTPPLGRALIAVLVVFRRVQDRDAEPAVGVDVGVEGDR